LIRHAKVIILPNKNNIIRNLVCMKSNIFVMYLAWRKDKHLFIFLLLNTDFLL
jgi:hypothetical protein